MKCWKNANEIARISEHKIVENEILRSFTSIPGYKATKVFQTYMNGNEVIVKSQNPSIWRKSFSMALISPSKVSWKMRPFSVSVQLIR